MRFIEEGAMLLSFALFAALLLSACGEDWQGGGMPMQQSSLNGLCTDFSGAWSITETVSATNCGLVAYTKYLIYEITQEGCQVSVESDSGVMLKGTVSGSTLRLSASYDTPTATKVTNITLQISDKRDSLGGTSDWTLSNGIDKCVGMSQIEGERSTGSADEGLSPHW